MSKVSALPDNGSPPWRHPQLRVRRIARSAAWLCFGGLIGLLLAVRTPARLDVVGGATSVWIEVGKSYDQVVVRGLVTLSRATPRAVAGEPLGVRAVVDVDATQLVDDKGQFDARVLPAYVQAYSDPAQILSAVRWALIRHLLLFTVVGALIGLVLSWVRPAYRRWRTIYDREHWPDRSARDLALRYHRPERGAAGRAAQLVLVLALVAVLPSGMSAYAECAASST